MGGLSQWLLSLWLEYDWSRADRLVGAGIWLTRAGVRLGRASSTLISVGLAGDWVGLVSSDSRPAQGELELSKRGL